MALLASALMAAPLWVGRFVPLLDLPQHLAITTVLLHHRDPAWQLAAYYEPQRGELTPYWAHYLAIEGLARVMPVDAAGRVFLTLYVLALPWAAMALARALGRPASLGLLAAPLALNANLYYGFIAYCWSVVVMMWALAVLARQLDAPRPARAGMLGVLAAVLFFTHVQSFAFLLLATPILIPFFGHGPPWRRALRAWPLGLATIAVFIPWLYLSTTPQPGVERYFPPLENLRPKYEDTFNRLVGLPDAVAGSYQDGSDTWLLGAWLIAVVAAWWTTRNDPAAGREHRAEAALLVAALACYFLLPVSIQGQWNIAPRFAWVAALLLPFLGRRTPRWLPAAALALSAATAANAAWHHARFDREAGPFDRALAALPPGARVLGLIYDPTGDVLTRWPYLHFEQYAVVRGGGMAAHSFTANAPLPVRLRPEARVPAPGVWWPHEFRYDEHGRSFDHFLVRERTGGDALQPAPGTLEEVFREGVWRVYRGRTDEKRVNGG